MSKYTSLSNIGALNRWVKIQCAKAGLHAEFVDDAPGPYTSDKCIYIPRFNDRMTEDDEAKIRGFVLHECLHHAEGPELFELCNKHGLTIKHPLGALNNMIEDQRIERMGSERYRGDAMIISDLRDMMGRDTVNYMRELLKKHGPNALSDDTQRMQAAFNVSTIAQGAWCPGASLHAREQVELAAELGGKVQEYTRILNDSVDAVTNINRTETVTDSFELAKKMYGVLWDKTPEEVEQELEQMAKDAKEGKDGKKGGKSGKGKGKSKDGDEQQGEKSGKAGKPGDGESCESEVDERTGTYKIPFEWFVKSTHEGSPEPSTGHGLGLDYSEYHGRGTFQPEPFDHMQIHNLADPGVKLNRGNLKSWGDGTNEYYYASSGFANQVRRYLQVRSAAHYIGGQTRGKIHSRALYRAGVPRVGSGEWNSRVFRIKHQAEILDTSVQLLVDQSGSMSGPKFAHATHSAMILNHVISNTLRVNTEILSFTHSGRNVINILKPFGTRVSDDVLLQRFDHCSNTMWGNGDADSIMYAQSRLLEQKTKRKVMIVLSDGSPADGYAGTDPYYALKRTVADIQDRKKIDIIGIGIMDTNVENFYKKHTVIKNARDLEDCLIRVIRNSILSTE